MKKIEFKTPREPRDTHERYRDEAHRRVANTTQENIDDIVSFEDQLIAAINAFAIANNLSGWNPPKRG